MKCCSQLVEVLESKVLPFDTYLFNLLFSFFNTHHFRVILKCTDPMSRPYSAGGGGVLK